MVSTLMDNNRKFLEKALKMETTCCNTNGVVNVALYIETFMLPIAEIS